jgi:hypothetical protein
MMLLCVRLIPCGWAFRCLFWFLQHLSGFCSQLLNERQTQSHGILEAIEKSAGQDNVQFHRVGLYQG